MPARDGSIDLLRAYVNLTEPDFRLMIAWLTAALRPVGPYPVLVFNGEQSSGKSTLARILRLLIDPGQRALPDNCSPLRTRTGYGPTARRQPGDHEAEIGLYVRDVNRAATGRGAAGGVSKVNAGAIDDGPLLISEWRGWNPRSMNK